MRVEDESIFASHPRLSASICGSILVFLGALGGLGGSLIVLGSLGVLAVQLLVFLCVLRVLCGSAFDLIGVHRRLIKIFAYQPETCSGDG